MKSFKWTFPIVLTVLIALLYTAGAFYFGGWLSAIGVMDEMTNISYNEMLFFGAVAIFLSIASKLGAYVSATIIVFSIFFPYLRSFYLQYIGSNKRPKIRWLREIVQWLRSERWKMTQLDSAVQADPSRKTFILALSFLSVFFVILGPFSQGEKRGKELMTKCSSVSVFYMDGSEINGCYLAEINSKIWLRSRSSADAAKNHAQLMSIPWAVCKSIRYSSY